MNNCERCGMYASYNKGTDTCRGCGEPIPTEQTSQKLDRIALELERYRRINESDIDFVVSVLRNDR